MKLSSPNKASGNPFSEGINVDLFIKLKLLEPSFSSPHLTKTAALDKKLADIWIRTISQGHLAKFNPA